MGRHPAKEKKAQITITVAPLLKRDLQKMVDAGDISSLSNGVEIALTEFFMRRRMDKEIDTMVQKFGELIGSDFTLPPSPIEFRLDEAFNKERKKEDKNR